MPDTTQQQSPAAWLRYVGTLGGRVKSEKKRLAAIENLKKANAKNPKKRKLRDKP